LTILDDLGSIIDIERTELWFSSVYLGNLRLSIWEVGEDTGKLGDAANRLADEYTQISELLFKELAQWLPRLVYFGVMAIMVFQILRGWRAVYGMELIR